MANRNVTQTGGPPGPFFQHIEDLDIVEDQQKVTTGFFTGNIGTLAGSNLTTASLSTTQKKYYYNLQYSSADQLSVSFGHLGGSGSTGTNGSLTNLEGETEAVYKYFANLTMDDDFAKKGFVFDSGSDGSTSLVTGHQSDGQRGEPGMYFIVAERSRMKDRINPGTWTVQLSGSTSYIHSGSQSGGGYTARSSSLIHLTDDSDYTDGGATSTVAGPRYNVISGSAGVRHTSSMQPVFGYFYPNLGLWALRESQLSQSLKGDGGYVTGSGDQSSIAWNKRHGNGLAMDTRINGDVDNAIKIAKALYSGIQTVRAEEDETTTSYFCRARAHQFNATNNPTFLSGSNGRLRNLSMEGNPNVFPTSVGLYDSSYNLVAIGRLSTPIQKNFKKEMTIKVNLTF